MKKRFILLINGIIICLGILFYFQVSNKNTLKESNVETKNNSMAIMIKEDGATEYIKSSSNSIPIGDYVLNEGKTYCKNNGKINNYNNITGTVNSSFIGTDKCYLYFDYKKPNLYKTIENRYNNGDTYVKLYDPSAEGDSNTYDNNIYYFNGAVENNNVLFGGYCWKMVRTTDTGGVKMIYNGKTKIAYNGSGTPTSFTPLGRSDFNISSNDGFSFNDTDKIWYSENSGKSTIGTVSFSIKNSGDYYIDFDLLTDNGDYAFFYKNGKVIAQYDGQDRGKIELKNLAISDIIKVEYVIDADSPSGTGNVTFSILKPTDEIESCDNIGVNSQLATTKTFNRNSNSPAYVGYMYNTVYTYSSKSISSLSNIVFGNFVTYVNGKYILNNTKTVETWSSGYNTINSTHYTCFTTGSTCEEVYYVHYTTSTYAYYITLTDGKRVDDALNEMLHADDVNKTDSTIKAYIDSWYKDNMISYTDKLEDIIFCNDRTILNKNGWDSITGDTTTYLQFKNYSTNYSLACTNETDRFSINNSKAKLTYPVGLLSAPEVYLAYRNASSSTYYLNTGNWYWLASPSYFDQNTAYGMYKNTTTGTNVVNYTMGVRPVISLKPNTEYTSGDGSYTSPFIVE